MIKSILLDFCTIETTGQREILSEGHSTVNLIDQIIIKHFQKGLIELSQDRVVNVRISLAECFYSL